MVMHSRVCDVVPVRDQSLSIAGIAETKKPGSMAGSGWLVGWLVLSFERSYDSDSLAEVEHDHSVGLS